MGSSRISRHRRSRSLVLEPLEGRALLSVVTTELPPAVPAANTVSIEASPTIHVDGFQVQTPPPQAAAIKAPVVHPKATPVDPRSGNASASDFASAGKKYLQTIFSTSTAKV